MFIFVKTTFLDIPYVLIVLKQEVWPRTKTKGMQTSMNFLSITKFIRANWFKIGFALILLYAAFRKDFSFQINLNTPVKIEEQEHAPPFPVQPARERKKQERLTDVGPELKQTNSSNLSTTEQFKFSTPSRENIGQTAENRLNEVDISIINAFVQRFKKVAKAEEQKFGIPASIILANGLLNSLAGQSDMATSGNNFFNLSCTLDWQGDKGEHQGTCYRYYENAWTSFRDHSLFLTTGQLSHLKDIGAKNYKSWASALEQAKINKEQQWAKQLVNVIEAYKLDQ